MFPHIWHILISLVTFYFCHSDRCPAGYQPNAGNTGCDLCPKGTYQELPDQAKCVACTSGQSTRAQGAKEQAVCESKCGLAYLYRLM